MLTADENLTPVAEAATADAGVDAVEKFRCDLVVLDLQLPDQDGPRLALKIRRRFPELPILRPPGTRTLNAFARSTGPGQAGAGGRGPADDRPRAGTACGWSAGPATTTPAYPWSCSACTRTPGSSSGRWRPGRWATS
ncbi:MAG: response regulator [Candidatus Eremiobacterota bacterium]